ncbi:MAG: UbiD family decarboxylase [Planctomycetaceae bacterium]|nr:UbiD family decarboxylase [Planctomycetaceae bacterium]
MRMGYRTLKQCVDDLLRTGRMVRVGDAVDMRFELAAIQRRVFEAGGPALYFECPVNPDGPCHFPVVSNLFGTMGRMRYIFRDTLDVLQHAMLAGVDPASVMTTGFGGWPSVRVTLSLAKTGWHARPKRVWSAPVFKNRIRISDLPQLVSWPEDGGAYITLPQVYTEQPSKPGVRHSNLGMYRVQLSGNSYRTNEEAGMHYQIQRGIANHHAEAIRRGERLHVNIFVGGAPAMTVAAVMPLPEGMTELAFAGMLGNHRIPMCHSKKTSLPVYAEADFCISGWLDQNRLLPEGPFGDHLGYYSMTHEFPVMRVENVWCRDGAIWPLTVVGRPPQEDSMFGELIHELTGPVVPKKIAGLKSVRAVDEAGVHPLLFVIGSERYTPFQPRTRAAELHTLAHACLGFGQLSLAKCLLIAAEEDAPALDVHQTEQFLMHVLARLDTEHDLHFITQTTCDTLDYSGGEINRGSKLIIASVGEPRRTLSTDTNDIRLPNGFCNSKAVIPGILVVQAPRDQSIRSLAGFYDAAAPINCFPLVVVVDDADFAAATLHNFLWVTFTRCDPASDIDGIEATTTQKHWGCRGSLIVDARKKPHHAPELIEDPHVIKRIEPVLDKILAATVQCD